MFLTENYDCIDIRCVCIWLAGCAQSKHHSQLLHGPRLHGQRPLGPIFYKQFPLYETFSGIKLLLSDIRQCFPNYTEDYFPESVVSTITKTTCLTAHIAAIDHHLAVSQ